jgi:FtsH-binding integral membrane protein
MFVSQLTALVFDVGATFGLTLVAYGSTVWIVGQSWPPLDIFIKVAAPIVTLLGTIAVVVSVYSPRNPTPSKRSTRRLIAPVVLIMILVVVIIAFIRNEHIPDSILLGFFIAAIFGSLMRLFPRHHEKFTHANY